MPHERPCLTQFAEAPAIKQTAVTCALLHVAGTQPTGRWQCVPLGVQLNRRQLEQNGALSPNPEGSGQNTGTCGLPCTATFLYAPPHARQFSLHQLRRYPLPVSISIPSLLEVTCFPCKSKKPYVPSRRNLSPGAPVCPSPHTPNSTMYQRPIPGAQEPTSCINSHRPCRTNDHASHSSQRHLP